MRKLTALTILFFAVASFALNYTGSIYVNAGKDRQIYLSPACPNMDTNGRVLKIGTSDILITTSSYDQFQWFRIPVSAVMKADTIAPFCIYRAVQDSVYITPNVGKSYYQHYYRSTAILSEKDFQREENLYVTLSDGVLYHKNYIPTTMYLKTDWKKSYVVLEGRFIPLTAKTKDGWYRITEELKKQIIRTNIKTDSFYVAVDDTSRMKKYKYDTLAVDTVYGVYSGLVSFTDTSDYCGGHYIYENVYNVSKVNHNNYFCLNTNYGIQVQNGLYIFENPKKEHETLIRTKKPEPVKYLHILTPQVKSWFGEIPALSSDGGATLTPMAVEQNHCGWFSMKFFEEEIPTNAAFYGTLSRNLVLGEDLNIEVLYEVFNTNELYYVATIPDKNHWFAERPDAEGICSVNLTGIVYDTDAKLHPAFSCYSAGGEGCQEGAQEISREAALQAVNNCIGVVKGIVKDTIGADHKPVLSETGKKCFISSNLFNQLFTSTDGVNETSCFDIPFSLNSLGKWEFSSDFYTSPGATAMGGFYPAEQKESKDIVDGDVLIEARRKRTAEGPVFMGPLLREIDETEGVMKFDLMCNGPGWSKGYDCAGKFVSGDEMEMSFAKNFVNATDDYVCIMGWSCPDKAPDGWPFYTSGTEKVVAPSASGATPRWTSGETTAGRNQHFCFESHAKFTYKKGQRFGVHGDDDIWIFIGGRLAIDLGGTHLAAPGYVDLDMITDKDGNALVEGLPYDIDIFFCDRRTTMSNMNFYSNIYLDQSEVQGRMLPCRVSKENVFTGDDPVIDKPTVVRNNVAAPKMEIAVQGRVAKVSGMVPGMTLTLMDMQGRVVGRFNSNAFSIEIPFENAGRYILKTGAKLSVVEIK